MLKRIMIASLAVGTLAFGAPAYADNPTFDCDFSAFQHDAITGGSYEGLAWGYVVHAGDTGATIRCYIKVNGVPASSTPAGTGLTAGRLSYYAGDTDVVTFHAEACTNHGCVTMNYETTRPPEIPPQEIRDLLASIAQTVLPYDECNGLVDVGCYEPGWGPYCILWAAIVCVIGG